MAIDTELLIEMVSALPDPVFILTESGLYVGIAGGTDQNFYHDGSGLKGLSLFDVLPEEKANWFLKEIHKTLDANRLRTVEYGLAGTDVEGLDADKGPAGQIWFEGRIQPMKSLYKGERAVVWVARNITRRHQLEDELRRHIEVDDLTGVYNRRKMMKELETCHQNFLRYGNRSSLIILDVDHFKHINDTYGHLIGDTVLRHMAMACKEQLREVDMIARIGGEEFAVVLPNTAIDEAIVTAERLRHRIENTEFVQGEAGTVSVTVSLGVSEFCAGDKNIEALIKCADDALYQAKRKGRNRVIVERRCNKV